MDPIANLFVSIKNAGEVGHQYTLVPYSKTSVKILEVLKNMGKISNFEVIDKKIKIFIAYMDNKKASLESVKKISKLGGRVYRPYKNFRDFKGGRGFLIVSTSKGIMSDREAITKKLGGEVIAKII